MSECCHPGWGCTPVSTVRSYLRDAQAIPEVAYAETLGGRLFMESPKSKRYALAYDRLRDVALDRREAAELIREIEEERLREPCRGCLAHQHQERQQRRKLCRGGARSWTVPAGWRCGSSKDRAAATLVYPASEWMAFVDGVKGGEFAP